MPLDDSVGNNITRSPSPDNIQVSAHEICDSDQNIPMGENRDAGEPLEQKRQWDKRVFNPCCRPRKLPISDRISAITESSCPPVIREKLKRALLDTDNEISTASSMPERLSWGDAHVLAMNLASQGETAGFRMEISREIQEMIEGAVLERTETEITYDAVPHTVEEVKKVLYGKFAELAIERARAFNMPLPGLQEVLDEAGIGDKLGIPREDRNKRD